MTFMFFWILVVLAYLADIGKLPGCSKEGPGLTVNANSTKEERREMEEIIREKYGSNLTPQQEQQLIQDEFSAGHSRAVHRVHATRNLTGGKKLFASQDEPTMYERLMPSCGGNRPTVGFVSGEHTVLESQGNYEIPVRCLGKLLENAVVKYVVQDGSAKNPGDYEAKSGMEGELRFGPDSDVQCITVLIKRSKGQWKEDSDFTVKLLDTDLRTQGLSLNSSRSTAKVTIVDEDRPGTLGFSEEFMDVQGGEQKETTQSRLTCLVGCAQARKDNSNLQCTVQRKNGSAGKVSCSYRTESDTATEGADFEKQEGTLEFGPNQTSKIITIKIMPRSRYDPTEMFRLIISDATGGASFDSTTDGGANSAVLSITLHGDEVGKALQVNWDRASLGTSNWKDQFAEVRYVGGSPEEQANASCKDWIMHLVFLPWRFLGAVVPPPQYCGGWLCFFCALGMVGFVTVVIGDTAELLGCCLGIPPATTAVTLVALGTSLPDTFASKTAANMEPYADSCIGNVTGSNSVNVFLGLGLPWMICALYWFYHVTCEPGDGWSTLYAEQAAKYPTGIFVVEAGALGTSVSIFCLCACITIVTLAIRRRLYKGEIGGPKGPAYVSAAFFVFLWLIYLVVSIRANG